MYVVFTCNVMDLLQLNTLRLDKIAGADFALQLSLHFQTNVNSKSCRDSYQTSNTLNLIECMFDFRKRNHQE